MRLIGQAKLGFYPTPVSVTEDILKIIEIQEHSRVLDPCCGEGAALAQIQAAFPKIETYGVELDNERAAIAKSVVGNVLNCDAIGEFRATNYAFDILWENPPYDDDVKGDDKESKRTEKKFLEQHRRYLKEEGGLLIYIIPFNVIDKVKNLLTRYSDLRVIPFPKAEYKAFRQVVIIGKSTNQVTAEMMKKNLEYLERIIATVDPERAYDFLPDTKNIIMRYRVTPTATKLQTFYTSRIDPDEAMRLVGNSTIAKSFKEFTNTKRINAIRPLTDLSQGHVAMLIAAGMMDGYLKSDTGDELVVRGFVHESFSQREEITDEEVTRNICRKQYSIVINAVNLTTGELVRVK